MVVLVYVLAFIVYYIAGLIACTLIMSLGVMAVRKVLHIQVTEKNKQYWGSAGWVIVGLTVARMVFTSIQGYQPSIIFVIICILFSIAGSAVGLQKHAPQDQIIGSIAGGLLILVSYFF